MGQPITLDKPLGGGQHPHESSILEGDREMPEMHNVRPCANPTCSATSRTAPAMLKTPHGWLCALCFRALHRLV